MQFSIKRQILHETVNTIEVSSIHGLTTMVANEHKPVKIMWIICILASASYCIYSIFSCVSLFLEYKVVTQVRFNQIKLF